MVDGGDGEALFLLQRPAGHAKGAQDAAVDRLDQHAAGKRQQGLAGRLAKDRVHRRVRRIELGQGTGGHGKRQSAFGLFHGQLGARHAGPVLARHRHRYAAGVDHDDAERLGSSRVG